MCVSKVQHMTGRKTSCNLSRLVFFGFLIFQQTSQLATEKFQNLCNCNRWSSLLQLGSVRFQSFFQSSELDLQTLVIIVHHCCVNTSFCHHCIVHCSCHVVSHCHLLMVQVSWVGTGVLTNGQ